MRPLTPSEQRALTDVSRVCRTCREDKPIDEFAWRPSHGYRWRLNQCRACQHLYDHKRHSERRERLRRQREELLRPIPASDPWLDLEVITVCWRDCVAEGDPAIRRMLKKIAIVCWAIGGQGDQLHAAATGYLEGRNRLAVVASALGDFGRRAVAS